MFMSRFSTLIAACTSSLVLAACMPVEDQPVAITAALPEEQPRQPVYRSDKRLSSDCGVQRAPGALPGLAPVAGAKPGELSEDNAKKIAIGADRALAETNYERVAQGYVVVGPTSVKEKVIVNLEKEVVGRFEGDYFSGHTRVLENGDLLTTSATYTDHFRAGGRNGCVELYAADGSLKWRVKVRDDDYISHHDIALLANGNFLAVVWDRVSTDEAIDQGRDPEAVSEDGSFWYDGVIEVDPYTLDIVWEWSARHHLIQEFDPAKRNYGVVAEHPELLDINKLRREDDDNSVDADWTHVNSIDYNAELDQIVLSSQTLSEIWVIDHSTTPWESMGHAGGRYGKGGDFLYRWGNPQNYNRGTEEDRQLYRQHDAHWIDHGLPGAGNILILNNGEFESRPYTTVTEITPPQADDGSYKITDAAAFGPEGAAWEYNPQPPERFLAWFISGVQRLPNGNTFINQGPSGKFREVTPDGEIVWEYEYRGVHDVPYMIFRANKYPVDHPGIAMHLGAED